MQIPVFLSRPLDLSGTQRRSLSIVEKKLRELNLEPLTLEIQSYPVELPLREVYALARRCYGGVIMGFEQYSMVAGVKKAGTSSEKRIKGSALRIPSPWNQIESGILFGLGLPLVVFREEGVEGGIFEPCTTDVFIHAMPTSKMSRSHREELNVVLLKWSAQVRHKYYDF